MRGLDVWLHGTVRRPSGFRRLNERFVAGLRRRGHRVRVIPNDAPLGRFRATAPPDVYLFHGDPYDLDHRPGRRNVFFLQWEYRRVPSRWIDRLDRFDLLLVPSRATAEVARRSGVTIPIAVVPGAVDPREIGPSVPPRRLPTHKRYRFLHFGGLHWRRGTDLVVRAYLAEFSADDDVALVLKGFHYERHRPWLERVLRRAGADRRGAAEVVFSHGFVRSIAGLLTAADCGVYPLRAECLGLPVLECIAAGLPVIATAGTGLDEFCRPGNAWRIPAVPRSRGGRDALEPDLEALRRLMRRAYRSGPVTPERRRRIAASVAGHDWERAVDRLETALLRVTRDRPRRARAAKRARPWHRSGRALEAFLAHPDRPRILLDEPGTSRIRSPRPPAIDEALTTLEHALADVVLVPSGSGWRRRSEGRSRKTILVPPHFPTRSRLPPRRARPLRFLFWSLDPRAPGLDGLAEAWAALAPRNAELWCGIATGALESPAILLHAVRLPSLRLFRAKRTAPPATRLREIDVLVAPTPDGDPAAARAMASGRVAILSPHSILAGSSSDEGGAFVARDGLSGALDRVLRARSRITALAAAAYATANAGRRLFQAEAGRVIRRHGKPA